MTNQTLSARVFFALKVSFLLQYCERSLGNLTNEIVYSILSYLRAIVQQLLNTKKNRNL